MLGLDSRLVNLGIICKVAGTAPHLCFLSLRKVGVYVIKLTLFLGLVNVLSLDLGQLVAA